jgi:hypothetical protein
MLRHISIRFSNDQNHGDIIMSKPSFMQTGHFPFLVLNTVPQSEHATMSAGFNIITLEYHILTIKSLSCLIADLSGVL